MKAGQARLMKVVQIESNYQKHRQRLLSIQHINAKKQPHITSIRPSQAVSSYKQNRLKADVYAYKTKTDQIQHENTLLMQKIERQYNKTSDKQNRTGRLHTSSSKNSLRSSHSVQNIQSQNHRFYEKINNTKSIYSNLRKERGSTGKANSKKDELLNLLVNQLGVKPSVLFPQVQKRKRQKRASLNVAPDLSQQQRAMRFHYNNTEAIRKKNSINTIASKLK